MIKIWGRKDSSNVQKVLWCCGELDVEFQRIDLGGRFGGNKEKPYVDLNPNAVVPTIEDGNFVLWESNSILRYLVEKYGDGKLLPTSAQGRADANRWMDWQLTTLGPAMVPLFIGLVRTPKEKQDRAAIDEALNRSIGAWQIVERYLGKTPYIAGTNLSIGDIPLGVWAYRWFSLPIERPALPRVKAWYDRLTTRPAYKTHIMIPLA